MTPPNPHPPTSGCHGDAVLSARHAKAARILTMVAGLLALAGCEVGPTYERPAVETPRAFKSATQPASQPAPALGQTWWQLFGDPQLTKLEQAAGESNQDLKAAVARVAQGRAAVQSTRSGLFPTIMLDPSVTRSRSSGNGPSGKSTTGTLIQIPLDLSYEVDIWGRVRRAIESSQAQLQASTYDVEVIRQTLQADVAIDYFALRSLDAQSQIVERNVALFRRQVELTERQHKVGIVSQIDVVQAQAQLDATIAQGIELQRQRADLEHALAILLGQAPADLLVAVQPLDLTPPTIPPGLPADLLRRRPDVAEAEANLIAANAQIGVATANFYPVVQLTGVAGFESISPRNVVDWQSRIWSLGPSVSIPIFEGGRLTAALQQAKARYEELQANYRTAVLNAYRDVEDALTDIHHFADGLDAQSRALAASRESLRLAETQYQQGLTSYLQVIDADRTLLANELATAQIINQRLAATVLLIKAIGGGWDIPAPATRPAP